MLLAFAGIVTAGPLILFAAAARRLTLATLGLQQYLAPTGQFLLAVFAYGEVFKFQQGVTFACIWLALGIYSWDSIRAGRKTAGNPGQQIQDR